MPQGSTAASLVQVAGPSASVAGPKPVAAIATAVKSAAAQARPTKAVAAKAGAPRKGHAQRLVSARWVASVDRPEDAPAGPPEVAICGRSNVGKSSLINALTNQKALARTSRTPGRTQRIQLFDMEYGTGQKARLVDLPGFGHAEVPNSIRKSFGPMIEGYLTGRTGLRAVFLLLDARRDADEDAISFAQWLREAGIGVFVIVTKVDKLGKAQWFPLAKRIMADFALPREPILTSSDKGHGIAEVLELLRQCSRTYREKPDAARKSSGPPR